MNYGNKARTRRRKAHNKERREREGEICFSRKKPPEKSWKNRQYEYFDDDDFNDEDGL